MRNHLTDEKLISKSSYSTKKNGYNLSKEESRQLEKALQDLATGSFEEKWATAKSLVKCGNVVIEPLQGVILDENADLEHRCFALRVLSQLKNPRIVLIATQLLSFTQEEELISLATQTLAVQGENAIEFLADLLDNSQYRLLACQALAQIPNQGVVAPLLSVVEDKNYQVRKIAIAVLRNFHNPQVIQALIKGLQDHHPDIRKESLVGLGLKVKHDREVPLIAVIAPLLGDLNITVAQQAAMSLSRCQHPLAVVALEKNLQSDLIPIELKLTMIRVLGWISTAESIACLGKFINTNDAVLGSEIVKVLGRVNKSDSLKEIAIDILNNFYESRSLGDIPPEILQGICYSWTQLGAITAIPLLKEIEASEEQKVHFHAQSALASLLKLS